MRLSKKSGAKIHHTFQPVALAPQSASSRLTEGAISSTTKSAAAAVRHIKAAVIHKQESSEVRDSILKVEDEGPIDSTRQVRHRTGLESGAV